jgi:hypothetical protein
LGPLGAFFGSPLVRYCTSGTLITLYLVADLLARRARPRVAPKPPRWLAPLVFVSVTAFYLLIGPTGGALAGGLGNLAGIAGVLVACALRFERRVRYPELLGRGLLYLALPPAVGVPLGWLALSLPACAASVLVARRADRLLAAAPDSPLAALPAHRVVPGIW